jgi:hypothetical protein
MKTIVFKNMKQYYDICFSNEIFRNLLGTKLSAGISIEMNPVKISIVQILCEQMRMINETNKFNSF